MAGRRVWISVLLLFGLSSVWGFGQTGAVALDCSLVNVPAASTELCSRGFFGWDDTCLLHRLRDPAYFGISMEDGSDQQILEYIKANEQGVAALLLQVEYGRDVTHFLAGSNLLATEKAFLDSLGQRSRILKFLSELTLVVSQLGQSPVWDAVSQSLGALASLVSGAQIARLAVDLSIAQELRGYGGNV